MHMRSEHVTPTCTPVSDPSEILESDCIAAAPVSAPVTADTQRHPGGIETTARVRAERHLAMV